MSTVPLDRPLEDEDSGGFFALMRHPNYRLLWTSQLISGLGDRIQWVAVVLWVHDLTGSALSVSFALISSLIAPAFVGFYAGAIVDRFDRRVIMIVADCVRGALVLILPFLVPYGLHFVYLDLFIVSIASGFFRPAMFATIPRSVPKDKLLHANAFFSSMDSSTEVIGPALGGVLIPLLGYSAGFHANALTFFCSAALVSRLVLAANGATAGSERPASAPPQGSIWKSVLEGMAYIRKDAIHVALLAYVLAAQWVVGLTSLQTPLARQEVGISVPEFGWFQSIWGLGFVAASLAVGWFGLWARRGQSIVFGYGLWALAALALGLSQNFGMLVVAGFWAGFANTIVFVNVSTVMMEHTPNAVIGRTITTRQVVVAVVRVVALLWFGWLADSTSIRASIVVMAIVSLAGNVLVTVRTPQLWRHGVTADAGGYREVLALGRRLQETLRIVRTFLTPRADKMFEPAEQVWLDRATATLAMAGWVALFMIRPLLALGAAVAVLAAIVASVALRQVARHAWRGDR